MTHSATYLLDKYGDIIKEEVNVKEVSTLSSDRQIEKQYAPIGKELSQQFGKDTGAIIGAAKQWHVEQLEWGRIRVIQWEKTWELESHQYEIRYQWFDGANQTVEEWVMVELNLTITEDLKKEWYAREISRFLNQMRKDADYNVDDRVTCLFLTDDEEMSKVVMQFTDYLKQEALLTRISESKDTPAWDITATIELEWTVIHFALQK